MQLRVTFFAAYNQVMSLSL